MALIVEDGGGVEGANSYVTLVEARAYATDRGLTLPGPDLELTALLIRATDYIESERSGPYQGDPTYTDSYEKTLKWPRTGVIIDGKTYDSDQIPDALKKAQCQLAFELQTYDPTQTTDGRVVKREKVDIIEVEYATTGMSPEPDFPKVDLLLRPLLRGAGRLRLVRI